MAVVVEIKVERSADRSHDHIVGVYTDEGVYRTNRQVAESIRKGERWVSTKGEVQVPISFVPFCPGMNCGESPYLVSRRSIQRNVAGGIDIRLFETTPDYLENLPARGSRAGAQVPIAPAG